MKKQINGIQQIGIGNPDTYKIWEWYRKAFKMDVPIFDEAAIADLMLPYTGGEPRERHAVLAMNMQGGSGFEIWQYTKRTPDKPDFEIQYGDLGIIAAKVKTRNIEEVYKYFQKQGFNVLTNVNLDPSGIKGFYLLDPLDNLFHVTEEKDGWFLRNKDLTGGLYGASIGVTDIDRALTLYKDILGYNDIISDTSGKSEDLIGLPGGNQSYRRVILGHKDKKTGAFSELLGPSRIELTQALDRAPRKIFENRFWGDYGFIHLCFDVSGMKLLQEECSSKGFPFTVDSADSFDMGEAAGHFSYIEDPDGTLIEFVETHKIPVIKKIGWYLNLQKRDASKPLPRLIVKALGLSRVKEK